MNYKPPKFYDAAGDTSKRWYIYFYVMQGGQWKRVQKYVPRSLKSSTSRYEWLRLNRQQIHSELKVGSHKALGSNYDSKKMSTAAAINLVWKLKSSGWKPRTKDSYNVFYEGFMAFCRKRKLQARPVDTIGPAAAVEFMNNILLSGKSAKTYNLYLYCLRSIWDELKQQQLVQKNIFSGIKARRIRTDIFKRIEPEQIAAITNYFRHKDPGMLLFIQCIYYLLARPAELLAVKIADIDLAGSCIMLKRQDTKSGKVRLLTIPDQLAGHLEAALAASPPKNYYLFGAANCMQPGLRLKQSKNISRIFARCRADLGLPLSVKLYYFKHTAVQDFLKAGIPPHQIQRQAGWSDMKILQIYAQIFGLHDDDALKSLPPCLP